MKEDAQAKINLGLWIHGKYPDGYHKLSTFLLPLELCDEINMVKSSRFSINGPNFGSEDFMTKSLKELQEKTNRELPVELKVKKNIPIGAGLAGGTADGAAVLRGLNKIYNLNYELEELQELSRSMGADFPYCLLNSPSIGRGRGDQLEKIEAFPEIYCILLNPGYSVATKDAYSWVENYSSEPDFSSIIDCLKNKTYSLLKNKVINNLEQGVCKNFLEIKRMKDDLYKNGAEFALMSGSGPTVYGFFSSIESRERALRLLKGRYKIVVATKVLGGIKNE